MQRMTGQNPGWNRNLDLIRVVAAFAVILLHVSADAVTIRPSVHTMDWWVGNVIDAFTRWCVPAFVILSGYLVIPASRKEEPRAFVARRMGRVIIPTLFWTAFYLVYQVGHTGNLQPSGYALSLLHGKPYSHLWYMYMLVGLYLFAPVIQRAIDGLDTFSVREFTLLIFLISSIESFTSGGGASFFSMFLPFVGYFIMGDLFRRGELDFSPRASLILFLMSGIGVAGMTGLLFPQMGERSWGIMYDYLNPLVILMSISLFSLLLKLPADLPLRTVSDCTLGIYLLHPMILILFRQAGLTAFTFSPAIGIPLTAIAAFIVSGLLVWALRRVWPGQRIV